MSEKFGWRTSVTAEEIPNRSERVSLTISIICILAILGLTGLYWYSDKHGNHTLTPKENALITEIFAYDYIVIDGIEYATKDICEIDPDWPYMTMTLDDKQVVVRFNTHEFTLHN